MAESETTAAKRYIGTRTLLEPDRPGFTRTAGDETCYEDGHQLYPQFYQIGSLNRQLTVAILYEDDRRQARFVFEISGRPKDGEYILQESIFPPHENLPWIRGTEAITLAEAKELGKWLCKKAAEYERPRSNLRRWIARKFDR